MWHSSRRVLLTGTLAPLALWLDSNHATGTRARGVEPPPRLTRDSNPALTELEPVASAAGLVSRVVHRRMTVRVDSAGILHALGGQPFTWGPSSEGGTGESNPGSLALLHQSSTIELSRLTARASP